MSISYEFLLISSNKFNFFPRRGSCCLSVYRNDCKDPRGLSPTEITNLQSTISWSAGRKIIDLAAPSLHRAPCLSDIPSTRFGVGAVRVHASERGPRARSTSITSTVLSSPLSPLFSHFSLLSAPLCLLLRCSFTCTCPSLSTVLLCVVCTYFIPTGDWTRG